MAENFLSPGIIVRELRAGVPQIRGVPTSVGAMVFRSLRGPVNDAIFLDSLAKAQRIFGDFDPNSFAMEQIDGFFKNGGSAMYGVRAEPNGGGGTNTLATIVIQSAAGNATAATKTAGVATYNLEPAEEVDLDVDNAGVQTATWDAAAATVTGSGLSITDINGETVILEMNNDGDTQTCTFTSGHGGDPDAAAAEMNTQFNGVSVDVTGGQIRLTSDLRGTASEIDITGGSALVELGLAVGVSAGSGDVADIDAVTALEFKTVLEADIAGGVAVDITGAAPVITSGTTGVSSELDFQASSALAAFGLSVETIVGTAAASPVDSVSFDAVGPGSDYNSVKVETTNEDTDLVLRGSALSTVITAGSTTNATLTDALIALIKVGDTLLFDDDNLSNQIRAVVSRIDDNIAQFEDSPVAPVGGLAIADTLVTLETFSVSAVEGGRIIQGPTSGLRMSALSTASYFITKINTTDDENVITATDEGATVGVAGNDNRPVNAISGGDLLATGSTMTTFNDTDYIGNASAESGLFALDKKRDVRLVTVPGVTGTTTGAVSVGLLDYCTAREDCAALMSPPLNTTVTAAVTYKNANVGGTSFGIMYYPYLEIVGPLTSQRANTPPEGFVMGVIARTDRTRGVSKAPAGELDGRLIGVIGVEREITDAERDLLYPANINPIENIEGVGQAVMGSRTMESGEFNQINVRRAFIFFRVSIKEGTRFVLFEPNDTATRAKVRRVIAAFLATEWKKGNLEGDTIEEAFFVICDKSNNPATTVNEGKMFVSVGVNIPRTTEFLIIEIQQDQRGIQAELGV